MFYADPFFVGDEGAVLVEALNRRSGVGEIVRIEGGTSKTVLKGDGHVSYPATTHVGGREIVVPETARWSTPLVFEAGQLWAVVRLNIEVDPRVLEPSLVEIE